MTSYDPGSGSFYCCSGIFEVEESDAIDFRRQITGIDDETGLEFFRQLAELQKVFAEVLVPGHAAFDLHRNQRLIVLAEQEVGLQPLLIPNELEFRRLARVEALFQRLNDYHVFKESAEQRITGNLFRRVDAQ